MGILSEPEAFEDMFSEKLCRIKTGTGGYVGVPQRLLGEGWTGEFTARRFGHSSLFHYRFSG